MRQPMGGIGVVGLAESRQDTCLAPGDLIGVLFSGAPEIDGKHKIQSDGRVSLPHVGEVKAAGMRISQFQASLATLYQPYLQDAGVVVTMDSAAAGVYVGGEVLRPGKIPLDRPMTVLQAVMEAGGFTRMADSRKVVLVRLRQGRETRQTLNLNSTLSGAGNQAVYLRPFDVIYVQPSFW